MNAKSVRKELLLWTNILPIVAPIVDLHLGFFANAIGWLDRNVGNDGVIEIQTNEVIVGATVALVGTLPVNEMEHPLIDGGVAGLAVGNVPIAAGHFGE